MGCQQAAALLAILLLAAGSAHAFMIVFEPGAGESTEASSRDFSSNFHASDYTSSALQPLFHPLSWLEQQLEEIDALQQATLENLLIERLEAQQLRDMEPEELESEMLHHVGCQRLKPAMHEYQEQASVLVDVQNSDARSDAGFYASTESQGSTYSDAYLEGQSNDFAQSIAEARLEQADAATLSAWFDEVNTDARSDVADLLSVSAYARQQDLAGLADAAAEAAEAALQRGGQDFQGGGEDLPFSGPLLLPLRGFPSEYATRIDQAEQQSQTSQSQSFIFFRDPLVVHGSTETDAELVLQDDEDDESISWPQTEQQHGPCSRMLDHLLLLRSLFWPQRSSTGAGGSAGPGALLSWREDSEPLPLLVSEHFTEEDLAASLTAEEGAHSADAAARGRAQDEAIAAAGAAAAAAVRSGAGLEGEGGSGGSYWLDLDNDGLPDVKLAMRDADGQTSNGGEALGDGVEVTEGAWRRFMLAALLTATIAMAAFFLRALLQLRAAMANAATDGRPGHVLVPVTLERNGRLVHGLMLLPEDESDLMASIEQGKGTLVGEWQEGKGTLGGEWQGAKVLSGGKSREEEQGRKAARTCAGASDLTEPLLLQPEEGEEAQEGVVVAAHYATQPHAKF